MIETHIHDSVVTLSLNRPEKRNALNIELLTQLRTAIQNAAISSDIRVLVLKGNGKVFCAGADLDFLRQLSDEKITREFAKLLSGLLEDIRTFPVPVLVKVHGACMGGAIGIVAAADIIIADVNTPFAFSEVRLGLIPAIISPYVLSKLPLSRALDLMLTGRIFSAAEAKDSGLVTITGAESEIEFLLKQTISQILLSAPSAVKLTRKMIWDHALRNNWQEYCNQSQELFLKIASSGEAKEGVNAFFEKRDGSWSNGNIGEMNS
jgi:methylglutaconyl-CoA hydratase